jgi:hypothetical protein
MILPEDYTEDELREHIRKKLGGSVWRLEGMGDAESDLIDQGITDALRKYSSRVPKVGYEIITTNSRQGIYELKTKPVYSVWRVDFMEPTPLVAPLVHNLLGITPVSHFSAADVASFIHWRKTFRRVISSDPLWTWHNDAKKLAIHNVSNFSRACAHLFLPREGVHDVDLHHKDFLRRYAIAKCKEQLGEIRSKFDDIPGPGGNTIKLNGEKLLNTAKDEIEKLEEELRKFQPRAVPIYD